MTQDRAAEIAAAEAIADYVFNFTPCNRLEGQSYLIADIAKAITSARVEGERKGLAAKKDASRAEMQLIYQDLKYAAKKIVSLEAQLAGREASAWRPIETAPLDGATILVRTGYGLPKTVVVWWRQEDSWLDSNWILEGSGGETIHNVTAWQPLPAPPRMEDEIAAKEKPDTP